ncbi:hypothetical protein [Halarcobacter bivalviorum]|uniref:Uncharacterized protein n=1 Tax=Halarcobacter bivalviorum TaxID=663364 RepID=A0AAX2A8J1_9BACT|nr:hypothetical protein [Halarcobacter bivalviorum]AXH11142.1 hypothetical protein ABIV_0102 [Halarcobacter bivalviorum]RXK06508.1 hypothetical protein CRU97_04605 [Halarcobacter bivalviorum]RXK09673.1 hypothetical protein CRV05_08030 [Halarcobacter bivalviorum]
MVEIASQIVLCLIIAALIGFFIGFIVGKLVGEKNQSSIYSANTISHVGAQSNIYNKPLIRSAPRPMGKDALQEIEGIDKNLEVKLNEIGIFHFDQIAEWNKKNCQWIEQYLKLEENQIENENWIVEARNLSKNPKIR